MFIAFFISVFAAAHVAAEIPSYIHVCNYNDPKLIQCILDNVENLKHKICEGIPELDIPANDPMMIDKLTLVDSHNTQMFMRNINITGLCDYVIKQFSFDIDKNHFDVELVFNKIKMNGTYDINLRILVPIKQGGDVYITTDNVEATVNMDMKVVNNRGKRYLYMSKMKINIDIKDYDATYNLQGSELNRLQEIIDNFIGNNKEEIIKVFKPALEKTVSQIVLSVANDIVKHFTYEELFPGRP